MAWNSFATPLIGKAVRAASRLAHGGGSAFPGKIVERIDPGFLARTLDRLPLGVVLVSGTNGKTTTTRMVAIEGIHEPDRLELHTWCGLVAAE